MQGKAEGEIQQELMAKSRELADAKAALTKKTADYDQLALATRDGFSMLSSWWNFPFADVFSLALARSRWKSSIAESASCRRRTRAFSSPSRPRRSLARSSSSGSNFRISLIDFASRRLVLLILRSYRQSELEEVKLMLAAKTREFEAVNKEQSEVQESEFKFLSEQVPLLPSF